MNRGTSTAIAIVGTIAIFFILGIAVYYLGMPIAKGLILKANSVSFNEWTKHYFSLVIFMTIISGLLTLLWYIQARFLLKITSPAGVNRRFIWGLIGFINIVMCIVVPFAYSIIDKKYSMSFAICVLFIIFFGIIGYYICSILFTPANYKYTPIGAVSIRGKRGGKNK